MNWGQNIDHKDVDQSKLKNIRANFIQGYNAEIIEQYRATLDHVTNLYTSGLSRKIREATKIIENHLESTKKQIENHLESTKKQIELGSSISYWEKRGKKHRNFAIGWGVAFALWLGGSYWFLSSQVSELFTEINPLKEDLLKDHRVYIVAFTVIIVVWVARIISRMMLSHYHLEIDASERQVLVNTYLALNAEGVTSGENEKILALASLFRPTSSGIVKEDHSPQLPIEYLMKRTNQ